MILEIMQSYVKWILPVACLMLSAYIMYNIIKRTNNVTHRDESDIKALKENHQLLYVINGEIDQSRFLILAESTVNGALAVTVYGKEHKFDLVAFKPTRCIIEFAAPVCSLLKYTYKFKAADNNTADDNNKAADNSITHDVGSGVFTVPPVKGVEWSRPPKFSIISCNNVFFDHSYGLKLWKELETLDRDITFLLGDQIYGDAVSFPTEYSTIWKDAKSELSDEIVMDRYRDIYRMSYHLQQSSMRNGMNMFMPDDHEFYDGAGTSGFDDVNNARKRQAMKAGYQAFLDYQMQTRLDYENNKTIYHTRQWGDLLYVAVDTRVDRFSAAWKAEIFGDSQEAQTWEKEPTWISAKQTEWFNKTIDDSTNVKYLIVSTSTQYVPIPVWSMSTVNRFCYDVEYYGYEPSASQFQKFIDKLFAASTRAQVLAINGDVHEAMIQKWKDHEQRSFTELTSSVITQQTLHSLKGINFWACYLLSKLYSSRFKSYTKQNTKITYNNNFMLVSPYENLTTTYTLSPTTFAGSILQSMYLKGSDDTVHKIEHKI